jgi:fatty acid desaturase
MKHPRRVSDHETTQPSDVRASVRLEGWKVAIAVAAAIVMAPVVGVALLVLLAAMLPMLSLLAPVFLGFWVQHRPPASMAARRSLVLRVPMSHPAAP